MRYRPRTGTKVTTIISLSLLACVGYFLFAPVYMDTANGWFGCGNVVQGADSEFVRNVCEGAPDRNRAWAFLAGALAVIIGGLGAYFFGFDSEVEHRRAPRGLHGHAARDDRAPRGEGPSREDDAPSRGRGGRDDSTRRPSRNRSFWDD